MAPEFGNLEGDPDGAGHAPADLDPIDELGLGRVGDLERRATRLEDHHPSVWRAVRLAFGQAEDVAIEPDRVVVVGRGNDEAQLADRTRIGGGHGASPCVRSSAIPRSLPSLPQPAERRRCADGGGRCRLGDGSLSRIVTGMGEDAAGELYVLTRTGLGPVGTSGEVLKLVPPGS